MRKTLNSLRTLEGKLILFAGLIFFSNTSWSQGGNTPCTATAITASATCSYSISGTTVGATYQTNANNGGTPSCASPGAPDVWFVFTAATTGNYVIDMNTGSITDSGLGIYGGAACTSLTEILCDDDSSPNGNMSMITAPLTAGTTYYLRVWAYGGSATGTFTMCLTSPAVMPPGSVVMASSGSTSACSGNFYDGGGLSDYANSDTRVFTICPSTAGAKLKLVFSAFQTESSLDILQIFDGNSVGATLIGTYSGSTSPGTVQASAGNATGCLTFRFTSDGSVVYPGWVAAISCITPCQTITSNWVSSNEAPMPDGVIRICQGQSINLVGSGTFGTSGTGATYAWNMGNGVTVSGANINYTYPAIGSYLANMVITDPSGCTNSNSINRNIEISTTPTITTSATPSTLCTGATSALAATVTMTPYTVNCTPPVSGTTFLPDGSGVSYSTSITTNCYSPSATVTAATDITNICLNMEHSFSGDLSIVIQCPNGQSTSLITFPSGTGSANLGTPWATATVDGSSATTTPGVGASYCFVPTGGTAWATGYLSGGTFVSGNGPSTYTDTYMPAGNYAPMQTFTSLVGCPLNGSWTIIVTDNTLFDNGYIFNWDINFSAAVLSASSFTPTIASQGWVAAATLTSTGTTTANVVPVSQGTPCFNYSVTDNFGCTYTSPQCITVNCGTSLPVGLLSFEASAVSNERVELVWSTSSETNSDYFKIERSIDGEDWQLIDEIPAAGNSVTEKTYSTVDLEPYMGTSYYRLHEYDLDGAIGTTDMEAVYFDGNSSLNVFPNPANSLVTVQGDLISLSTFELTNNIGQNVKDKVIIYGQGDSKLVIDLQLLETGIYFIKYAGGSIPLVKI